MNTEHLNKIFSDGVLVSVHVSFWSGAITLNPEDLGLDPSKVAKAFKLGKKYLIPEDIIRDFRRVEAQARNLVDKYSFDFPVTNARFIPKAVFSKVMEELEECKARYNTLTAKLVANYEDYKAAMVPVYTEAAEEAWIMQRPSEQTFGPDYDPEAERLEYINQFLARIASFYPSEASLPNRFSLGWSVFEIALPQMAETDGAKVVADFAIQQDAMQKYRQEVHTKIDGFVDHVVQVLRSETADVCGKVIQNIKDGKVIHGRTMNSLKDFIDRFRGLNFVGDQKIEDQLNSLQKEFLDVYPTKAINESEELQVSLGRKLDELVELAAGQTDINEITGQYRREISWED